MTDREFEDGLLERFERLRFEALHIERRAEESDWTVRLGAIGPKGEVIRGLALTIKSPTVLTFGVRYEWLLLSSAPLWVIVKTRDGTKTFSRNTSKVTGTAISNL